MKEIKDKDARYHKVYNSSFKEYFIKQHYLVPFAFSLRTTVPLFFDPYRKNRITGSIILIDETTNETVAAGMIV